MFAPTSKDGKPVLRLRLNDTCITDVNTGRTIYALTQAPSSGFMSSPLLIVTIPGNEQPLAFVRTGSFHMSSITITMHDDRRQQRQMKVATGNLMKFPREWLFTPDSAVASQPWVWQRDDVHQQRSVVLKDRKVNGRPVARITGEILTCVNLDVSAEVWMEVVLTALALAEHVRRQAKRRMIWSLSGAIYNGGDGTTGGGGGDGGFGSGDGGSGGDGGGGGGDGGGGCS